MTVTHIVLLRWATDDDTVKDELRAAVQGLADKIDEIDSLTEGPSTSPEGLEAGFEYGFVIAFASHEARDVYLDHPAHLPVAALIQRWSAQVLVFDI